MSASINPPLGVIGGLLALGFVLATVASRLHADPVDQRSGCSDPTSQLQCYCRQSGVDGDLASATNFVAPCYLGGTQVSASRTFEMFSAWSWSALNWPVSKKNGVPKYKDDLRRVKGDNSTVWESWKTTREVFRADGRRPLPWSSRQQILPASCAKIDVRAAESNYSYAESIPDTLPPRVLTDYLNAEGDIVVDRNGELVRYETAMNKVAYDYIVNNGLYNTDEQAVFFEKSDAKIAFPAGQYSDTRGSYWVKAAWKVLGPNDRADEIHKAWAYLVPVFENGKMIANCSLKPVGLVGLHITYKLETAESWAWATFEHVRNAPTRSTQDDYYFYDPKCAQPDACAPINTPPRRRSSPLASQLVMLQDYGYGYVCPQLRFRKQAGNKSEADSDKKANYTDSYDGEEGSSDKADCNVVHNINQFFARELKPNVWGNYRLKGTQWFDDFASITTPMILANTVLEPYTQATSSCLGCHGPARTRGLPDTGTGIPGTPLADKIFALQKAQSELEVRK